MNPDLLRQRRNLLLISIALILFDFAEISVTEIQMLGAKIPVGKPEVLIFFAWLVWAYFGLRYYQHWRDAPNSTEEAFRERLDVYARAHTKAAMVQDEIGQPFDDYRIERKGPVTWSYVLQDYESKAGQIDIPLPTSLLIWWHLKAGAHVSLHTPHVTDSILPFIVAIFAGASSIWYRL